MHTEVEMKAWLKTASEKARVKKYLSTHGKFLKKVTKQDTYFARQGAAQFDFRLREVGKKYIVTQKTRTLRGKMEENAELEFEVSSKAAFFELAAKLGYEIFIKKTKIAEIYELPGKITAEIVQVTGLGDFLEIEKLCAAKAEISAARKKIQMIFAELELQKNIEAKQYALLLKKLAR